MVTGVSVDITQADRVKVVLSKDKITRNFFHSIDTHKIKVDII